MIDLGEAKNKGFALGVAVLLIVVSMACGSSETPALQPSGTPALDSAASSTIPDSTPQPTDGPLPDPRELLDRINAAMLALSSVHVASDVAIKRSSDADSALLSLRIEADGKPSGNIMISLTMVGANPEFAGTFELEILQVDGIRYTRPSGARQWTSQPLQPDTSDPLEAMMIGQLILEDLEVALDSLNNARVYRLTGSLPRAALPGRGTVTMWVDTEDAKVRRMQVSEEILASEYEGMIPTEIIEVFRSADYEFSRFDERVEISAPDLEPPDPSPVAQPLREGWTRYSTKKFGIDLPEDWIALEVSTQAVATLVQELQTSNPTFAPYVTALFNRPEGEFWAFDPESPPGVAINLSLRQEAQWVPLNIYAAALRQQFTDQNFELFSTQEDTVGSYQALTLSILGTGQLADGEPFDVEAQRIIIDDGQDLYVVTLTYTPALAQKYRPLFESIIGTFRVIEQ